MSFSTYRGLFGTIVMNRAHLRPQSKPASRTASLLLWEVRWTAVEAAVVGVGLWLTQFTRFSGIGNWLLVCLLGTSFCVRSRHYSKVSR